MSLFKSRRHKDLELLAKHLERTWDKMSYEEQDKFRKDYWGFYITLMYYIKWVK